MDREKPNVVLIMSDQHHAGVMGCAGDRVAETPALDRLASNGVRFSNAYCPFPLCGPSRMSFMTGRHPYEIGVWDNETQLHSDTPTFAHAFLAAGYDTALAGRMHFVGWDQRHGFVERILGDVPESVYLAAGWKLKGVLGDLVDTPGMSLTGLLKSGPGSTGYHAYDEAVTHASVEWLRNRGQDANDTPFLLTVGYAAPHCPFVAPPEDFDIYRDRIAYSDLPLPDHRLHPLNAQNRRRFGTDPPPPLDAQWRTRIAYYGLCTFLDRQVGAVLQGLADAGLADDSVIVYCSDHGEMLGEHGMWWKSTLYDGASRVPLLVSWPRRVSPGLARGECVSLMDIGPTLLDLAGVDPLPGASGSSFRSLLVESKSVPEDSVFAEYAEPGTGVVSRMVRTGGWKYNYYHDMPCELFDLQNDPGETINLSGSSRNRSIERRLHDRVLRGWDPNRVTESVLRRPIERQLIGNWVRAANPPEPDPLWFSGDLLNRVDTETACPGGDLP
jgi:choline-sulfatase